MASSKDLEKALEKSGQAIPEQVKRRFLIRYRGSDDSHVIPIALDWGEARLIDTVLKDMWENDAIHAQCWRVEELGLPPSEALDSLEAPEGGERDE
jgi:hypothetical protein